MRNDFSTPLESWLVIALIAILSAPILGVVVSGCGKTDEGVASSLEYLRFDSRDDSVSHSEPQSPRKKASVVAGNEPSGKRNPVSRPKLSEGAGKERRSDPRLEGEKAKSLEPETSPALQSARRLRKIFAATERALSDSKEGSEVNSGSNEEK